MNNSVSEILRQRAKDLGLTEAEISEKSGVPQSTVHRILSATSRDPRRSNVLKIATALGLDETSVYGGNVSEPLATYNTTSRAPLISWVQAGDFCEAIDLFQPGDAQEWVPCPPGYSDNTFALRVQGASMEPRFHEGEIIIVDPNASADSGRFVIARKDGDKTVTFKQLMNDGDQHYLKALNPDWPNRIIEMNEDWHICGVVTFKMEML